jgi:hypothetical protein
MICAPSFSLFEAMSALELMDPKMDESLLEVGREGGRKWREGGEGGRERNSACLQSVLSDRLRRCLVFLSVHVLSFSSSSGSHSIHPSPHPPRTLTHTQPVESVASRLARGELPTQVSLTQAARVVGGMLAYEVRKGRREGGRKGRRNCFQVHA